MVWRSRATSSLASLSQALSRLTNARGADCDHAPAVFLRALDRVDRLLGHAVVFGVHVVFVGIFGLHYAEGVEPYFEVHGFEANTLLLKAFEKLPGVKWSPAVGAAALFSSRENTVW